MADLTPEQMTDLQTFRKLLDAVANFHNLPHKLIERVPMEIWMEIEEDDEQTIIDALRTEITKKIDTLMETIRSVLREHRKERTDNFFEGYVLGCFKAGKMDLIASSPAAERASARLQAESLLRKEKPPE